MLYRTAAPTERILEVADFKVDQGISHAEHDARILRCLVAAEGYLDAHTGLLGRAMAVQTWKKEFPRFSDRMKLDLGPLISVDEIQYWDADDVSQTFDASLFYHHNHPIKGPYLVRKSDTAFPAVRTRDDAVSITFQCGHSDLADIAAPIRAAITLLAGHLYRNTEETSPMDNVEISMGVHDLINPFRRVGV